MNTLRIFVYGTLKKGCGNHRCMQHAGGKLIGPMMTAPGYLLLCPSHRAFPYMVVAGTRLEPPSPPAVLGELYEVTQSGLKVLDSLEGHPHHYRRTEIILSNGDSAITYMPTDRARAVRTAVWAGTEWPIHTSTASAIDAVKARLHGNFEE